VPLSYRQGPINSRVGLHPESDVEGRVVREFAGAERVYWAQCPRCRQRYWFALRYDTGATELQFFGRQFRERFRAEQCPAHSLDPLIFPDAAEHAP
jgi:uncharacterized protein with PIN domain